MSSGQLAGIDWNSIFQAIPAAATARALQVALAPIAGSAPTLTDGGGYWSITFTPEQEERVSAWILTQLNKEPGPVRLDTSGIALRVVFRKYWPYMLGLAAVGAIMGYSMRKGRR